MSRLRLGWRLGHEGVEGIELDLPHFCVHSWVLAASGSGKTAKVVADVIQLLRLQRSSVACCVIDMKGEMVELLLALLALLEPEDRPSPREICSIAPGLGWGVPLNVLARIEGLPERTQAAVVVDLLDGLSENSIGPRMAAIARWLVRAVMALEGSLLDVHRCLTDDAFVARVAEVVPNAEVRHYLTVTYHKERAESLQALRARIENLLANDACRQMLCARGSIAPSLLLESRLSLVNLALGELGGTRVARFIGGWLFTLVSAAIFRRDATTPKPHAYVVVDEFQELVRAADDIADVLARARSAKVSLCLINQYSSQIRSVSPSLYDGVVANVLLKCFLAPSVSDLASLGEGVLPLSGRMIDLERPDRLLSEHEERRRFQRYVEQHLGPRRGILYHKGTGRKAELFSTLTLPIERARAAWAGLPEAEKDAWQRGAFGCRLHELPQAEVNFPAETADAPAPAESPVPRAPSPRFPRGRAGRLRLEP
ncbi:MAG: hypothetical protein ACOZNI_19460 [Myxococcota bacterium]